MFAPLALYSLLYTAVCFGQNTPYSCDSPIYCYGDLLRTVQLARIYNDSKTFVDMKMSHPQQEILSNYAAFMQSTGNNPTRQQVMEFVKNNFQEAHELDDWTIPDYNPRPAFVKDITNATVRNFTVGLIKIWPDLARKVKPDVGTDRYSFIPVPNGFIIPGGRFREYYYWDSYWILDGLLISEMHETARGMIDNFLSLVQRYGFVPNGGRVYYLKRSQPPLLTPMAHLYYSNTKNRNWLQKNIDVLAKELNYWVNQTVNVRKGGRVYTLAHYDAVSLGPRPESYREDINTASYYATEAQQQQVYVDLKSGAESGWDFSSRWIFDQQGGNQANLSHIQTRRVLPVDLNAFLCKAYSDISELYTAVGRPKQAALWNSKYLDMQKAIEAVLWNQQDGVWYDYDLRLGKHRRIFYPSGVAPLWAGCFCKSKSQELGKRVLAYLQRSEVLNYLGGIPTSKEMSGEQWDFPNAWPPLQDIVVRGLDNADYKPAREEARVLAKRWVESNVIGFQDTGEMFEKYDAVVPGQYGGGGEYEVQSGFGWTNGVALRFVYNYYRNTGPPGGGNGRK